MSAKAEDRLPEEEILGQMRSALQTTQVRGRVDSPVHIQHIHFCGSGHDESRSMPSPASTCTESRCSNEVAGGSDSSTPS